MIQSFDTFAKYVEGEVATILYYNLSNLATVLKVERNDDGSDKVTVDIHLH